MTANYPNTVVVNKTYITSFTIGSNCPLLGLPVLLSHFFHTSLSVVEVIENVPFLQPNWHFQWSLRDVLDDIQFVKLFPVIISSLVLLYTVQRPYLHACKQQMLPPLKEISTCSNLLY